MSLKCLGVAEGGPVKSSCPRKAKRWASKVGPGSCLEDAAIKLLAQVICILMACGSGGREFVYFCHLSRNQQFMKWPFVLRGGVCECVFKWLVRTSSCEIGSDYRLRNAGGGSHLDALTVQ